MIPLMHIRDLEHRDQLARQAYLANEITCADYVARVDGIIEVLQGLPSSARTEELGYRLRLSTLPALAATDVDRFGEEIVRLWHLHLSAPTRFPTNPEAVQVTDGHPRDGDGRALVDIFRSTMPLLAFTVAFSPNTSLERLEELREISEDYQRSTGQPGHVILETRLAYYQCMGWFGEMDRLAAQLPHPDPSAVSTYREAVEWFHRMDVRAMGALGRGDLSTAASLVDAMDRAPFRIKGQPILVLAQSLSLLAGHVPVSTSMRRARRVLGESIGLPDETDCVLLVAEFLALGGLVEEALQLVDTCALFLDTAVSRTELGTLIASLNTVFRAAVEIGYASLRLPRFATGEWTALLGGTDGTVADLAAQTRTWMEDNARRFDERNRSTLRWDYLHAPRPVPRLEAAELIDSIVLELPPLDHHPLAPARPLDPVDPHLGASFFRSVGDQHRVDLILADIPPLPQGPLFRRYFSLREVLLLGDPAEAAGAAKGLAALWREADPRLAGLIELDLLLHPASLDTPEELRMASRALPVAGHLGPAHALLLAEKLATRILAIDEQGPLWWSVVRFGTDLALRIPPQAMGNGPVEPLKLAHLTFLTGDHFHSLALNGRVLRHHAGEEGNGDEVQWRIPALLGRGRTYCAIGNYRASLTDLRAAEELAGQAGMDDHRIRALALQLDTLFEARDLRAAEVLSQRCLDIDVTDHPAAGFHLRFSQTMTVALLSEPHFSRQWSAQARALKEIGALHASQGGEATEDLFMRICRLVTLLNSLGRLDQVENLTSWAVGVLSAAGDGETHREALIQQAAMFFSHGKHRNAVLIMESLVQRARRAADHARLELLLELLEDWADRAADPRDRQAYRTASSAPA